MISKSFTALQIEQSHLFPSYTSFWKFAEVLNIFKISELVIVNLDGQKLKDFQVLARVKAEITRCRKD